MRAVAAVVMAVVALGPKSRLFWVYGGTVPKASLVLMHIQNSIIFCNTDKRGYGGGYLCVGLLENSAKTTIDANNVTTRRHSCVELQSPAIAGALALC